MKIRKNQLIKRISGASGDRDLLLDFMEMNGLDNLMEATEGQLTQYVADYKL